MSDQQPAPAPQIVDAYGKPARQASKACPKCGAGPEKRIASGGYGTPHPVCAGGCNPAYEWIDEVWRG